MLPAKELAKQYANVTWLFVSRSFKDDERDREAARTHDRFGVTSWPQMLIFDPRDDRVLGHQPRDLPGFQAGLERHARALPPPQAADRAAAGRVAEARELAAAGNAARARALLEEVAEGRDGAGVWLWARELLREYRGEQDPGAQLTDPDVRERAIALERILDHGEAGPAAWRAAARARLLDQDEHVLVRLRALRVLARLEPAAVAAAAGELLAVDHDAFRFAVLETLQQHPDPRLSPALLRLFEQAGGEVPSRNPNVLRIQVAKCLQRCGDGDAIAALAQAAARGDPRNGLTGAAVDALAAIGARVAAPDRRRAASALLAALPPGREDAGLEAFGERGPRMLQAAVQRVHAALAPFAAGPLPAPPAEWTAAARAAHLAALQQALPEAVR